MTERFAGIFLLLAVFVIAVCGLVYELLAAALSTYLVGGSITHFSIVIGVFLTAMGLGSYLTRFVETDLVDFFVGIQIAIGLSGGCSAAMLLGAFSVTGRMLPVLLVSLSITGTLVGMEIPLLIRILRSRHVLRVTVANVLALDYIGALVASCAFPLFFVPYVGLLRTSFLFGLINVAVAAVALRVLGHMLRRVRLLRVLCVLSAGILTIGLAGSGVFSSLAEDLLYQDQIIMVKQTPYQRLVVTRWRNDLRLYIGGALQFSTIDEHRYHESLVHPAMLSASGASKVLILGGGDGMTAREVLKYPTVKAVDLVDLDAGMIELFRDRPMLAELSGNALSNPKLHIHIQDAGKFLEQSAELWDVILVDLPDPSVQALGRLYTGSFYRLAGQHLAVQGVLGTQATSPFYAPEAFWCIVRTLKETSLGPEGQAGFHVFPYHAYVPSFGDWGFVMASRREIDPGKLKMLPNIPVKFLSDEMIPTLFAFPQDVLPGPDIEVNRLNNQILVQYYRRAWKRFGP
ncbi:MAG: polyamine aminopropyltransferase [Thermodesulfobacteriota bacterium]